MADHDPTQPYEAPLAAPPAAPPPPPGMTTVPVTPVAPVVQAPAAPRSRRGRLRWLVALVITALVVATAAGATLLLTASAGDSAVLAYVPADTIAYEELRLDLPGSQQAEVTKLLSAFPGFADQASFGTKMNEVLDRLVKSATNGKHDYQTEIAPWFGGQLALAEGPLPKLTSVSTTDAATRARLLALMSVKDAGKATAWIDGILKEAGATTSTETYNGVSITRVTAPASATATGTMPDAGYAVLGNVVVAGDLTSVKAAIDTKGTSGLGTTPEFRTASSALSGDRIGFYWTDLRATVASGLDELTTLDKSGAAASAIGVVEGMIPAWSAGAIRAADGNLVVDGVQPHAGFAPTTNRTSAIAAVAPAGTVALVDVHDVGARLTALHDQLAADATLAATVKQVDSLLGLVGGFDAAVGWIGDAGVAVMPSGASVTGGVLITPADAAAATKLFTQLHSLLQIATAGSGTAIKDEAYGGTTITTVDLSAIEPLLAGVAGGSSSGSSPLAGLGSALSGKLTLSYAVTDQVVVLSPDISFVKAVLDTRTGASLAEDARFSALVDTVGAKNTGLYWLDITAIRGIVEANMPADARARYDADVKPYLAPLDAFIGAGSADGDLDRSSMILSIKH
jgi:hypothetical protein